MPFSDYIMGGLAPPRVSSPQLIWSPTMEALTSKSIWMSSSQEWPWLGIQPRQVPSFPNHIEESSTQVVQLPPPKSINRFSNLSTLFLAHFTTWKFKPKPFSSLLGISGWQDESLRDFLERYNTETLLVE